MTATQTRLMLPRSPSGPKDRASATAQLAAAARALACTLPGELQGSDYLAADFLDPTFAILTGSGPMRRVALAYYERKMPGAFAYLLARTKRIDEFVRDELAAGATQLVVLGAGYDSRAYRLPEVFTGQATVFEVDAPSTSREKRQKVAAMLGELPGHVRYVECDFNRQSFPELLAWHGFDRSQRTAFVWEGVSFYIDAGAVESVLRFVARCAEGSALVFDYLFKSVLEGRCDGYGAAAGRSFVAKKGEPFSFGLPPTRVADTVGEVGLTLETNLLPPDLEARYLRRADGSVPMRIAGYYGIATARVDELGFGP